MSSSTPWMKFYPRDWRGDQALRVCSLAARGLWMEMLSIMHEAKPYGHLVINGRAVNAAQLGALAGTSEEHVRELLNELEAAGVFSRNRDGVVYSRRMTRDEKSARKGRKAAQKRWSQAPEKQEQTRARNGFPNADPNGGPDAQRPEAREGKKDPPNGGSQKTHGTRLPDDWQPCETDIAAAKREGLSDDAIQRESDKFRDYWHAQPGQRGRKADWSATWRNWCRKAAESRQQRPNAASSGGRRKSAPSVVDVTADLVSGTDSQ